jgi:cobyrinic acid a,c-diamide synthase
LSGGLIIAAPSSASGKTTITLGLLRALRRAGLAPRSVKLGPDYLDPGFHAAASGADCLNLDIWAMRPETFDGVVQLQQDASTVLIAEGVMGLFDGATIDRGSTADVAAATGWPVVLVVDAGGMSSSIAALAHGFATFRTDVRVAGVIANRVGSARHADLLREALATVALPLLGAVPRDAALSLPSRHLGLVLASEHPSLDPFLEHAADVVDKYIGIDALAALTTPARSVGNTSMSGLAPLAQRIAVARDDAFAFCYPLTLKNWRQAGAEIEFFSPLGNETPSPLAGAVYLPGGYPELHAQRLAGSGKFLAGLRAAASRGALVFGECGGFMVLGESLQDAAGDTHAMAGLLPVETTFARRKLTLGYRDLRLNESCGLGSVGTRFRGHEFHFAQITRAGSAPNLFECSDARGVDLGVAGLRRNSVMGSFMHLIDTV